MNLLLLPYLGLGAGLAIAHNTRYELDEGKKYFEVLKPLIFSLSAVVFMHSFLTMYVSIGFGVLIALLTVFWHYKVGIKMDPLYYALFAVMIVETASVIIASLIFFYGIIHASLRVLHEDVWMISFMKLHLENITYVLAGILLLLI